MPYSVATLLMFDGKAEEAMTFYTSPFSLSKISHVARYGPGEAGRAGTVKRGGLYVSWKRPDLYRQSCEA
jgi:predicted 3-demethylubiquinone-9 3-methyltransferase (glyoxalase superfamily)